jgi:hypothetical protein
MNYSSLQRCVCLAVILLTAMVSGCRDAKPSRVKISGQVLFDGKPFKHGYIRFIPKDARQSTSKLDQEGRFSLSCFTENDGAVLGAHAVEVVVSEPISETKIRWHAPMKYANTATSGLTQEVTGPMDNVVINLKSDDKKYPYVQTVE